MTDLLRIAVHGAAGRMGSRVIALAREERDMKVVAAVVRPGDPRVGRDLSETAGGEATGIAISERLPDGPIDAAIDFSEPDATRGLARLCADRGIPMVVATTGLDAEMRAELREASRSVPVLVAANLSLGVALLTRLVREAARALGLDADVEIVETHHRRKMDAPSGTALHLARAVAEARGQELDRVSTFGRHGIMAERRREDIAIHALRLGDVVGEHTVAFGFGSERIELVHKAHSRDVFARGALKAARFVARAAPGLYGPEDVIGR